MPDQDDAEPLRGRKGRALNPRRGVARNGRPLVNTNCPSPRYFMWYTKNRCYEKMERFITVTSGWPISFPSFLLKREAPDGSLTNQTGRDESICHQA